jgi:hypothetical protein
MGRKYLERRINILSISAKPVWCAVKAQAEAKNNPFARRAWSFAELAGKCD